MDLKAIQHEEEVWSKLFQNELQKQEFKKFSAFWWEDYYNEIINFVTSNILVNLENKNILEAWSGSWKSSLLIWNYVDKITLLDISESALKYAKFLSQKLNIEKNIIYVKGNIFNMDFEDNIFDFTWNIWTIEHYNIEDIKNILNEMIRVTKNNWYIALWFPNFYSWPIIKAWLNNKLPFLKWYKLDTEIFYTEKEIINLINSIESVKIQDLKVNKFWNFMPMWTPKILIKLAKKLEKIFYKNKFLNFVSFKIIKNG